MDGSRTQGRADDVKHLKDNAQVLMPIGKHFVPSLDRDDKATRGFRHPQLSRLICPVAWLEEFDESEEYVLQI